MVTLEEPPEDTTRIKGAEVTWFRKLFHIQAVVTRKVRTPMEVKFKCIGQRSVMKTRHNEMEISLATCSSACFSALEIFLVMRYINLLFTYLVTYF